MLDITTTLMFQVGNATLGQDDTNTYITGPINWSQGDPTAEDSLQSRLNALPNIANNPFDQEGLGVRVTRGNLTDMDGFIYSITFVGHRVHGDVSQVTIYENKLGNTLTSDDVNITVRTITQGKMVCIQACIL